MAEKTAYSGRQEWTYMNCSSYLAPVNHYVTLLVIIFIQLLAATTVIHISGCVLDFLHYATKR